MNLYKIDLAEGDVIILRAPHAETAKDMISNNFYRIIDIILIGKSLIEIPEIIHICDHDDCI